MKATKEQMADAIANKMGARGISPATMSYALQQLRKDELERMYREYFPGSTGE